jgi:hypothetical protein
MCFCAWRIVHGYVLFCFFVLFFFFHSSRYSLSHTVQAPAFYPHFVRAPPYRRATVWRGRHALLGLTYRLR